MYPDYHHDQHDQRYPRPSRPRYPNNSNSRNNNAYQSRKRRSSKEPNGFTITSRRDTNSGFQSDPNWLARLERKVKETIPETINTFTLASYKEIEEGLDKLNYSKNDYSYLAALDELLQEKKIYMVHQKPDVFALQPTVQADKLEHYLIFLGTLKMQNTIKNAPKKGGAAASSGNYLNSIINTMNGELTNLTINHSHIKATDSKPPLPPSRSFSSACDPNANQPPKPVTSNCSCAHSATPVPHSSHSNDLSNRTNSQCDLITSSSSKEANKENEDKASDDGSSQTAAEENCKEESIKDLPNKIVISNMVASKSGDKQKAKRRKARRIRKATKNSEKKALEKANCSAENADEQGDNEDDEQGNSKSDEEATGDKVQPVQEDTISSSSVADVKLSQAYNDKLTRANKNLECENSSQLSSANSDSTESLEILPDSEIYPSEDIYQKISEAGFDYESIITRFANWNRSPISALNEFGQICHISVKLEITDSTGPDHAKLFQATSFLDKKKLSVAWGKSKKRAKGCASELAIRAITASLPAERCDLDIEKYHNHYDQLAVLSYAKFNELLVLVPNYVNFGRKIVATVLMKTPEDDYGQAVAVGTGNRCVSGEYLVTDGRVIFDSHAEVIARRSFLNFLMKHIEFYQTGEQESIFEKDADTELLAVKPGYSFHLYISTAPCGDGALFTHSSNQPCLSESENNKHTPLFETFLHGRLRTKMESGEGTISLDENFKQPELDQILRGERLRTMSCSDKICRWNLLGFQGCLLLHFIKPIYLTSISLGALYHNGHLSRACCCRLDQSHFAGILEKHNSLFRINHPNLGCPTSFKFPREPVKTKSDSLNWSLFEETPELTNGNTGLRFSGEESRICKFELFNRFKRLCDMFGKNDLKELTYYEVKAKVENYNETKKVFFDFLKQKKYGPWVCKPMETKVFK